MKAAIISASTKITLSPLLENFDIQTLPVMGEPIITHIRRYLNSFNIADSNIDELYQASGLCGIECDNDGCVVTEINHLTALCLSDAVTAHKHSGADITAVVIKSDKEQDSCRIQLDNTNRLTGLSDDICTMSGSPYAFEGIFVISRSVSSVFSDISGEVCGRDIIKIALRNKLKIMGYISDKPSVSITSVESYRLCHTKILDGSIPAKLNAAQIKEGFWIENGADLESGVKIETPVYISRDCRIERGAIIGGGTFIGRGCTVYANAGISHSVLGKGCRIGENVSVNGGILANDVSVWNNSVIMENAAIGSGCRLENNCIINSGVRIWPNKRILEKTRLNDNLVWGSVATEHIFRNGKICGEINVDITPEFMAKLGAALGTLYSGAKIGLGFDSAPICPMLASAISAGLTSSGASLFVFGEQSLPMTRCGIRYYKLAMGVHINQASSDGTFYPEIEFIESDGSSFSEITEQKLEDVFFNNVFLRADTKNLKESVNLSGYRFSYVQDILNSLKSRSFFKNMEARTRSETISEILELLLSETELRLAENPAKEFSVDIEPSGQSIKLSDTHGRVLDNYYLLAVISAVLINHLECTTIVLPVSAPSLLESFVLEAGAAVLHCGASEEELMHTLISNNLMEQFRLCFDGVYFAITLLDYLNYSSMSFSELSSSIPEYIRRETEVECPISKKADIFEQLRLRYGNSIDASTAGIKIYQDNGWVLIMPEKYRHYIKIITDGSDMEAANEISAIFTNQIKKLAKPQ